MGLDSRAQTREIGGRQFKAQPVAFDVGLAGLHRLSAIVAGILGAGSGAAALIAAIPKQLTMDDLRYFADLMGKGSWALLEDGRELPLAIQGNRAEQFAGDYLAFIGWLAFCLEVNYGPFFAGVKEQIEAMGILQKMAPTTNPEIP